MQLPKLVKVEVLLRRLPHDNPLESFFGFLDLAGEALNPRNHRKGRFRSWLTHFLLVLTDSEGSLYVLERTDTNEQNGGVVYRKLSSAEEIEQEGAIATMEWSGEKDMSKVEAFANEQRSFSYSLVDKNCQHFAYDFFRNVLSDPRAFGPFERFTEECQWIFVDKES